MTSAYRRASWLYDILGPIRDFLLRFNEALGEFGKIEVAGPYSVGK
jgi:hypothetical protein